jgi:hypothetical protein
MAENIVVRNLTTWETLGFANGSTVAPGAVATIDLDAGSSASETPGDRNFGTVRAQVAHYQRTGRLAIVGADS